jgi:hypothetical protein
MVGRICQLHYEFRSLLPSIKIKNNIVDVSVRFYVLFFDVAVDETAND